MKYRLILIAIALIAGIYSCSNSTENSDVLTKPTIEILASDPVPMQIKSIINVLGLAIEKPNPYINSPSDKEASILSAKEGVIVEYSYHDGSTGRDYSFKISEEEFISLDSLLKESAMKEGFFIDDSIYQDVIGAFPFSLTFVVRK